MVTPSMRSFFPVVILLIIPKDNHGFIASRTTVHHRGDAIVPPLYYTDIEPEVVSITVPPPAIDGTSSSTFEDGRLDLDDVIGKTTTTTRRRRRRKGAGNEMASKGAIASGASSSSKTPSSMLSSMSLSLSSMSLSLSTMTSTDKSVAKRRKRGGTSFDVGAMKSPSTITTSRSRPAADVDVDVYVDDKTSDATDRTTKKSSYEPHRTTWLIRYNELRAYREENGHCVVPQSYAHNPKLGLWVMHQRRQYALRRRGANSSFDGPDGLRRMRMLEDIGFVWRVERGDRLRRRGPHVGHGRTMHRGGNDMVDVEDDGISDAVDFESYMIGKRSQYTDEDIRDAWRRRFDIFR
ncbi:hypothetical protein ACHAXA_005923 [Cyclostephanos tholiformis]|uniref:Helicase-associated domain-containing protein n=1 Tax=Cyclostephanos tholiformis TaxID=382380 RepID=A0ABD3SCN0_9STRA